ncbi:hypothetical protein ACFO26_04990 [Lactococcus nasutitermitis]|uniref:N-acetyltransferase domain-containing protein n=1 Tax=Lactococcus nasutitermitis TaxID=1652957 RepID=A0ABV9JBU8_9LACT|nr:hypothetical protein [Lactococcus nasutitermitis]
MKLEIYTADLDKAVKNYQLADTTHTGNAASALTGLFDFISRTISPEITTVVLAVNAENINAQKAYQKAGFQALPRTFDGKIGKLLLMEKKIN